MIGIFTGAAVAIGILPSAVDGGLGRLDGILAAARKTLGLLENFFVSSVGDYAPFNARHMRSPLKEEITGTRTAQP
jgi:hypothetical protein